MNIPTYLIAYSAFGDILKLFQECIQSIFVRVHVAHGYYGKLWSTYLWGRFWYLRYLQICYFATYIP